MNNKKYLNILVIFNMILLIIACNHEKEISTIFYSKNIKFFEDSLSRWQASRKGELMDGTYKIMSRPLFFNHGVYFRCPFKNFSIETFKNGLADGEKLNYKKGKLDYSEYYRNGLLNGTSISYINGVKNFQIEYQNGLPNGKAIIFAENGIDTSYFNVYKTSTDSMTVYLHQPYISDIQYTDDMNHNLQFKHCLLKADKYPVRYYLLKDNSFITEKFWIRVDSCSYKRKEDIDAGIIPF